MCSAEKQIQRQGKGGREKKLGGRQSAFVNLSASALSVASFANLSASALSAASLRQLTVSIILVVLFFTPGYVILYHPRRFNLLKQIFFVVVVGGGGGGGSDVKMGCTIYWKKFSPFITPGVCIVRSFC